MCNATSLGGNPDTMTCIAGGIAQAFYGPVPAFIARKVRTRLPENFTGSPGRGLFETLPLRQGWLEKIWPNGSGFSVDAMHRVEADDHAGLERSLRYCAHPPFALGRLEAIDAQRLMYHLSKPQPNCCTELMLNPSRHPWHSIPANPWPE